MEKPLTMLIRFTVVMPSLLNTYPPSGGNGFTDSNYSRKDGQANLAVMSYSFQYPSSGNNDFTKSRSKRK